jgi:hypothetical protein
MATWPSSLKIITSGHKYQPFQHGVRWTTDDGASYQRRTATAIYRKLTGTVLCESSTSFDVFWNFYTGDAKQGGEWFTFSDPILGSTDSQARFIFGNEPEISVESDKITAVNITLEIKE